MFFIYKNKSVNNIRRKFALHFENVKRVFLPPAPSKGGYTNARNTVVSPFGGGWGEDMRHHKSTGFKPRAFVMALMCLLTCSLAVAQPGNDGLTQEEIDVTKTFDAVLKDAKKYSTSPALPEGLSQENRNSVFNLPPRLLELDYEAPAIKPIPMKREAGQAARLYWGKIGYGIPNQPYVDFRLNNGPSDWLDFNLQFRHHSANNDGNVQYQRFGNTDGVIDGTYYTERSLVAIGGRLGFDLDRHHFFGSSETVDFTREALFQRFLTAFGELRLANSEPTVNDLNYWLKGDFHATGDNYQAREYRVGFNLGAEKWIDKNRLGVEIDNHYRYFSDDNDSITTQQTNNVLAFQPYFVLNASPFRLKAGAYLGFDGGDFVPYPDIEASVAILEGKASLFAGWTGEIQQAQFREIGIYNPYIKSVLALENTRVRNLYGGVKGKFDKLNVEARATQKDVRNLPMYLTDYTDDRRRFDILYDSVATIFALNGVVDFELLKNINLSFSGTYNIYGSDAPHWHLPTLESNIGAKYNYNDQISLKAELYTEGGIPYLTQEGAEEIRTPLLDLNLGGTYRLNDNFSLFLDLNNLFASNYQRWNRYPQLGLNFVGGVIFKY